MWPLGQEDLEISSPPCNGNQHKPQPDQPLSQLQWRTQPWRFLETQKTNIRNVNRSTEVHPSQLLSLLFKSNLWINKHLLALQYGISLLGEWNRGQLNDTTVPFGKASTGNTSVKFLSVTDFWLRSCISSSWGSFPHSHGNVVHLYAFKAFAVIFTII